MGATPGRGGTLLAQTAWLQVLRTLSTRPWFGPRMAVSSASNEFDAAGRLSNDKTRAALEQFMAGFVRFIVQNRA
jgi:NAD(P)H-dependent FMN reductase